MVWNFVKVYHYDKITVGMSSADAVHRPVDVGDYLSVLSLGRVVRTGAQC